MKRNDVRAKLNEAGVEAEKIDALLNYLMDENGKDINNAKNIAESDLAKANAELETLKKTNTELTTKVDGYKDYEELKKFKADSFEKAEKTQRTEYLKSIGCKHPDLFEGQIDWSKASYDTEKKTYTGLDEAVKGLKSTYKDMFEDVNTGNQISNQFNPNLGQTGNNNSFADDPVMKAYLEKHPDAKII